MKSRFTLFLFSYIVIFSFIFSSSNIFSQTKDFIGTRTIEKDGKKAFETIPAENKGTIESLDEHLRGMNSTEGEQYVLGGTVLWSTQDAVAIANVVALNDAGNSALTGWGLNDMRVTLYSDVNSNPIWNFPTEPYDPAVDISSDGSIIAATKANNFYLLDPITGNINYQLALSDSFYASAVSVSRDGSMAVFLANAWGNSSTYRIYALNLSGTPSIAWTFDVPASEVTNWAGVNFSADGSTVAITGRYHLYVFNSIDGTLIWEHFVENTESKPAISGDGQIVATADNSGFIQTWHFNSQNGEYYLLWQYHVPAGLYINWASSVGISADGSTIVAGSLIFLGSTYDGTVMCFDTYGNGTPKWIYSGLGDLVDDISVSDDGRVAAAVTWGNYYQTPRQDLFVFDVATGQSTFQVSTPGSFFTVDMSSDGKRVFAGGKAAHAREFGSGGYIYLSEIELGGGHVSGNVDLTNSTDDSGVIVKAVGTVRSAVTDINGNYVIENIPEGTYTISAGKPGYNFGLVTNVTVNEGGTTSGVNFSLNPFTVQPPVLSASNNEVGEIILGWILPPKYRNTQREIETAKAVGDPYPIEESTSIKVVSEKNQNGKFPETDLPSSISLLADSVYVYRSSIEGGPYLKIGSVSISQLNYTDTEVFPLRRYYYVVNIVTDIGQSGNSNEAFGQVSDSLLTFSVEVPEASIPTIDGVLSPGEWDDAIKVDISDVFGYGGVPIPHGSAIMYLKFDDNNDMLYIAGEDFLNPTLDDNEGFGFYIDDNNDNIFNGTPPYIQEGNFWAYWHPGGSNLRFRDLPTYVVDTLFDAEVEFTDVAGHLQGEVAIPMGFSEGYQLQVFGPDKIVGLGAFLIGRNGSVPIYHGWWPQTMLYVYDPITFGNVGINVSLLAPPQAPSNIEVTRQGEDLLLTWNDPTLGLNNDPLPVPPTIKIYRNDELLTTLPSGVQSYLDNVVYCAAWYEYKLVAYFVEGTDTLTGPVSSSFGKFACQDPVLTPISYDDGAYNGFYYVNTTWENNKFAVRFTPTSYPTYLRGVQTSVNGKEYFDFTVQMDDHGIPGDTLAGPYRVHDAGMAQVGTILKYLPGLDPFEVLAGDFWIVINWLQQTPYSPYICGDTDIPIDNRSYYYTTSTGWTMYTSADFMLTAYVSDQPVGVDEKNENKIPLTFELKQNYPNPFNPSTVISYQIPQNEMVSLEIYNALGQKVRTLVNETQEAGQYEITWDGKNNSGNSLSSGVYLYRIVAGSYVKVIKMMLVR